MKEQDRTQRYAESLEKVIKKDQQQLVKITEEFQTKCLKAATEKNLTEMIVAYIRQVYREIKTLLAEIRAVQLVLKGKYRHSVRRNPLRDRMLRDLGYLVKSLYLKFERRVMPPGATEATEESANADLLSNGMPGWFREEEKRVALIRNIRLLDELDYQRSPDADTGERRRTAAHSRRFTCFLLRGSDAAIDLLQAQIRIREHDIVERTGDGELRGVLTHLKGLDQMSLETAFRRLMEHPSDNDLRCVLVPISSLADLTPDLLEKIECILLEMPAGSVRTVSPADRGV